MLQTCRERNDISKPQIRVYQQLQLMHDLLLSSVRLLKPTQRDFNPDVYLIHVGTNDLSSNKSPEQIPLDILNLANSLKLDNNTVIVSTIVLRDDEN